MTCDRAAQLHAYHDGELNAADSAAVEAHAAQCPACGELLADLRRLSRMIAGASRAEMPDRALSRFHGQWYAARDRGMFRIVSSLTAAAAAVLAGAIWMWPARGPAPAVRGGAWEIAAVTPPAVAASDGHGGDGTELVQVAQWIVDDLSYGERR